MTARALAAIRAAAGTVHVAPGDVCCAGGSTVLLTVLGSCVSVCLWDCVRRRGGMNHFVLPTARGEESSARFGTVAIPQLLERMLARGSRMEDLRAKLFGGAAVLSLGPGRDSVGAQNVRCAVELLSRHGLPVVAERTGGVQGVALRFEVASGDVLLRRLNGIGVPAG